MTTATFSPDGSRVVTASEDHTARIWDAASAKEIAVLRGHGGGVTTATFSPDGSRVVTASEDHTARIWDSATAKQTDVLRGHESGVASATFSPDGSRIVTASEDHTARIWDSVTAREIVALRGHESAGSVKDQFEYLEDLRPSPPLYPTDVHMRARCRLLELIGDEVLAPLAIQLGYRTEPQNDDAQVHMHREAAGRQAEADIAELYNDLTRRLGPDDFFCGDFSYADIALFMAVLWVLRLSGPHLDTWPGLARWHARVGARNSVAVAAAEIAAADRELSPPIGHE